MLALFDTRPAPSAPLLAPMPSPIGHWLEAALDELAHGMIVLDDEGRVVHANRTARALLAQADHPLQLVDGQLRMRPGDDATALREALHDARVRGRRRLLLLGRAGRQVRVAAIPLGEPDAPADRHCLLMLGRDDAAASLSLQWFACQHQLTPSESRVLDGLCAGCTPSEIAQGQRVALSTVRTQISSIRGKTGAGSIRDLLRQVAALPPVAQRVCSRH